MEEDGDMQEKLKRIEEIAPLIGNTPLLEIHFKYKNVFRKLYAKAEHYNLTGSIKDRVALYILKKAYEKKQIAEKDCIVEATSGNMGISFAAIGTYLGHPVEIYMPDWMSEERIKLIQSYGAKVQLVSREQGGFLGSIAKTKELGKNNSSIFLPCQFENEDNTNAQENTTAKEILRQLGKLKKVPDAVVAGVGTGGTIMGLGNAFRKVNPHCLVHPLEPLSSPTLSTGYKVGQHCIQGISDEFIPELVNLKQLDHVIGVDDGDAIEMARKISMELGIGIGISSGANFLGCVLAQEQLDNDSTVVTVFADDNKKYLSTEYAKKQDIQSHYLTPHIQLLGVKVHV